MTDRDDIDARFSRLREATSTLRLPSARVQRIIEDAQERGTGLAWMSALVRTGPRVLLVAAVVPIAMAFFVLQAQEAIDEAVVAAQDMELVP